MASFDSFQFSKSVSVDLCVGSYGVAQKETSQYILSTDGWFGTGLQIPQDLKIRNRGAQEIYAFPIVRIIIISGVLY